MLPCRAMGEFYGTVMNQTNLTFEPFLVFGSPLVRSKATTKNGQNQTFKSKFAPISKKMSILLHSLKRKHSTFKHPFSGANVSVSGRVLPQTSQLHEHPGFFFPQNESQKSTLDPRCDAHGETPRHRRIA